MKVFILGCGFLGSKLAQFFKKKGALVTVTTTSASKVRELEAIADEVLLLDQQTDLAPFFIHQDLLLITAAPQTKELYEEAYLKLSKRVLEALKNNVYIKQIIYTSSCSVYGEKEGEWVSENHSLDPINSLQKLLCETEKNYLNSLSSKKKIAILRLGEIYGLEKSMESKIEKLASSSRAVHGGNYTNLIHVEDVVRAVDFLIQNQSSGVFNLCNDSHLTRKELYDKWCKHLNLGPIPIDPNIKNVHFGNKRVSNQKIKLMGFEFQHPIAEPL